MGEAINLVNNFKVEKVIFNCGEFNELEQDLIKVLDKKKIPYYSCMKELNIDNSKLYFLNNKDYANENDNSSVIYTELKKEHIGQIQVYMNYIDKNIKTIEENKTVGIIICKLDNKYVIEFCSDDRIIAREYELV